MSKITLSYENEEEKRSIICLLQRENRLKSISKPKKSGKYYRVYIEID